VLGRREENIVIEPTEIMAVYSFAAPQPGSLSDRKQGAPMTDLTGIVFYLCPICFEPDDEPTSCPRCGGERATCRPGAANDPGRKPVIAATGEIKSHAPVWWLRALGRPNRPGALVTAA
jgi:hypothetical protein